jgi:dihydrofolate synthase/folylpolyglutamate synthase
MSQAVIADGTAETIADQAAPNPAYVRAVDQLYALGQELAPLPPLPDGTPAPRRKWDLEHMRTLCAALGNPHHRFPSVLIAGTNGKGSTAATLASILAAAGYKTALYTSPHLVRVNERIQILPAAPEEDAQPEDDAVILSAARSAESKDPERLHTATTARTFQPPIPNPEPPGAPSVQSHRTGGNHETPESPGAPRLASETWDVNSPAIQPQSSGAPSVALLSYATGGNPEIPDPTFTPGAPRLASETWDVNSPAIQPQSPGAPSVAPLSYATGGNHEIPDPAFARLFSRVDDTAAALVASGSLPHPPSFFEVLTALAFLYFAEEQVDIAILEVGLGGRLDATNIVEPILSVITDIALDHQEYLGDTIAAITREKAGILRSQGTLITLPQHPEANQAIGEAAALLDLEAISAADFIPQQTVRVPHPSQSDRDGWDVDSQTGSGVPHLRDGSIVAKVGRVPHVSTLRHGTNTVSPEPLPRNRYTLTLNNQPLHIGSPLPGHHQQRNIALAIASAVRLRQSSRISNQTGYIITNSAIEAGIRNTRWPGRLEFLPPNLLLDVAHNPAGAWTLRAAIAQLPEDQPRTLIFSCLSDKNLTEMSRILFPLFDSSPEGGRLHDHIILAPIDNPRAAKVEDLLAAAHALDIPAHASPHLAGALAQARAITPPGGLIVATGSVYLVGAIRDLTSQEQRGN